MHDLRRKHNLDHTRRVSNLRQEIVEAAYVSTPAVAHAHHEQSSSQEQYHLTTQPISAHAPSVHRPQDRGLAHKHNVPLRAWYQHTASRSLH